VDTPPKTVTLNFKNKFRLTRVTSTHGSRDSVNLDTSHLTDFAKTFELPFVSMGAGQYRIEWRGLGSDSHVQSGAFKFTVVMLSAFVFALDAVFLTGSWAGIIEHDMLALLWQSQNGDTLSYRAVGFALVGVGCLTGRVGRAIALLGAALILWSFVLRGHIADRDSLVLAILLLLHLGVACIWFGILLPLRQLTWARCRT